ncbi:MAG TPA: cellulase family glycosylhydrolase, partial [Polyangiaceae bacterium]|nr:cellulase family glycosylhydrolase [Polyangiaceae bacterium]
MAPIGHEGRWLTDAEGRVLLVHGVNVVAKEAPYYPSAEGFSDADAAWLADNGFRVVRVGILATGLMPTPGVVDAGYIQQVAATVSTLAAHDVYSLLDFHQDGWGPSVGSDGFPAWMTLIGDAVNDTDAGFPLYYQQNPALQQAFQSFWDDATGPDDAGLQDDYATMFSAVATQFAREPHVLGYDLFNEPWPGTTWSACLNDANGCPSLDTGELGPAYAKAIAAIRAAGDQHLVFGEPFVLFNYGVSATSIPVPGGDSNAGMSFHVYPLSPNQAPDVVSNAVTWSTGTGGALLDTEWGASVSSITLTPESAALDSALVPWIFWSLSSELVPSLTQ